VGTALTFAIVISLTAALGTLVPLAVLNPAEMTASRAALLLLGLAVVILGLVLCARAGALKEAGEPGKKLASGDAAGTSAFAGGLLICILSGATSPMFNFGVAFGSPIKEQAEQAGANPATASSAILALAISSGFLVNAGYCLYLLLRNRSWRPGADAGAVRNTALAVLMGLLWMFGMFAYGIGATRLGSLGPVLGWPLFMTIMVLMGNARGTLAGEWRGASRRAFTLLQLGNAAMILAFVIIAAGAPPA
jgi:L-rhamnose-H+ transport protein